MGWAVLSVDVTMLSVMLMAERWHRHEAKLSHMDTELAARPVTEPLVARRPTFPGTPLVAPPQAVGLALATLEAVLGRRGLHQLRPWLSTSAFRQLVAHVESGMFERSVLGRLRTQMPTPFAVEASARILVDARWLACTVRLDRAETWQCSDLMVLGVHTI